MTEPTAHIEIRRDGELHDQRTLDASTIAVGRASASYTPEVVLADEGSLISRRHCVFTQRHGSWWVEDTGSQNGTHVRTAAGREQIAAPVRLAEDDVVCIIAAADDHGPTSWWEITLRDPSATAALATSVVAAARSAAEQPPSLTVDVAARRVLRADGSEVELRRQGLDLVVHMAARNAGLAEPPALCTTDELLVAVWGPREGWDRYRPPTSDNLRDVILAVRKAIEPDPRKPAFLVNQRGVGYRLNASSRSG